MKPECFSEIGIVVSSKGESIRSQGRREESVGETVGFRLCPCKLESSHFHRVSGPWCDIPSGVYECLPEGMPCSNIGRCRFKDENPGIGQRFISGEEVKFQLKRALLVEKISYHMGSLYKILQDERTRRKFPRGIIT